MVSGWRYRLLAVSGILTTVVLAVLLANSPTTQRFVTSLPVLDNLKPVSYPTSTLLDEVLTTAIVSLGALWPLFKPRPRRILDTVELVEKRVFLVATALATIGYFDWSVRLPRTTLIATTLLLAVFGPLLFVYIRRRPTQSTRALIVGDDGAVMEKLQAAAESDIVGFVSPPTVSIGSPRPIAARADGGEVLDDPPRLGGLSSLTDVLVDYNIDTVLLGFQQPDRQEFFGTLAACHDHGIQAMIHREHADGVLVADSAGSELVRTDLEPWDWQEYALKRVFDVCFATLALAVLSPVILCIVVAIRLDSRGSILYRQRRTAAFGNTFTVFKFRSMIADAEATTGATISAEDAGGVDPRVTRVGRVLRTTHLDEIPQLWAVLTGDMSVVGPRPERPELDADIQSNVHEWRSRWFVKPGLTGLAQINGVTGHDPQEKLRYDIEYIRNQSLAYDAKIVVRQLYQVGEDVVGFFSSA